MQQFAQIAHGTTNRRAFLRVLGGLAGLSGLGVLAACQQPQQVVITPAAATAPPATSPAPAGASPAASPAASPPPGSVTCRVPGGIARCLARGLACRGCQPKPGRRGWTAAEADVPDGRAAHGTQPVAGPTSVRLARTFDTGQPEFRPQDAAAPGTPDIQSSVTVGADGTIFATNFIGYLFALRDSPQPDRLDLAWQFRPAGSSPRHSTPAIGRDGTVYVHFSRGMGDQTANALYAVRAPASGRDGQEVWTVDLGPGQTGGATGLSPTIGSDGTIYQLSPVADCIDRTRGPRAVDGQAGPAVKTAPSVSPDGSSVYTASMDGKLYAVAAPSGSGSEGSVRWTFDFGQNLARRRWWRCLSLDLRRAVRMPWVVAHRQQMTGWHHLCWREQQQFLCDCARRQHEMAV